MTHARTRIEICGLTCEQDIGAASVVSDEESIR